MANIIVGYGRMCTKFEILGPVGVFGFMDTIEVLGKQV